MDAVLGDNVPLLVPTVSNDSLNVGGPAPPVADVDINEVEDLQAGPSSGEFNLDAWIGDLLCIYVFQHLLQPVYCFNVINNDNATTE